MKNFKDLFIWLALIASVLLMPQLRSQTLPEPTITDSPNFNFFNSVQGIEAGDVLFLYYIDNDSARLSNSSTFNSISGSISGMGSTLGDQYDDPLMKNGFDFGQAIHLGLMRDGNIYECEVPSVKGSNGQVKQWKWYPFDLNIINEIIITADQIEVFPSRYQEYILAQCPTFWVPLHQTIEKDWMSKAVSNKYEWINGKKTLVGSYTYDITSFALTWTPAQYYKDKIWEIVEGSGTLKKVGYSVKYYKYYTSKQDHERGYVIFKFTAIPLDECQMHEDPFIYVKYNFIVP